MITRFEVGKSYRWIGENRPPEENCTPWNQGGKMNILLDGKPHKVTRKDSNDFSASFEDCEYFEDGDNGWWFDGCMQFFEEVEE